jgi:hypothetical protein
LFELIARLQATATVLRLYFQRAVVVAADDFAEADLTSRHLGEHERIEGQQQFVILAEFVREDEANGEEPWAPKGQTPVLQYHFTWKTLSVVAGITFWNFYFRLFPGTIRSPQIIEFLTARRNSSKYSARQLLSPRNHCAKH